MVSLFLIDSFKDCFQDILLEYLYSASSSGFRLLFLAVADFNGQQWWLTSVGSFYPKGDLLVCFSLAQFQPWWASEERNSKWEIYFCLPFKPINTFFKKHLWQKPAFSTHLHSWTIPAASWAGVGIQALYLHIKLLGLFVISSFSLWKSPVIAPYFRAVPDAKGWVSLHVQCHVSYVCVWISCPRPQRKIDFLNF